MASSSSSKMPVAIVGIGCRFPGGVQDAAGFWRFVSGGGDAIREIPADRIDLQHFFDARPATPGRIMTRWGGFLDQIDQFDAAFFGISPREAERLDPAQRLTLETAWEGLEDGGIDPLALEGSATGVFLGQWLSDFEGRLFADPEAVDFFMTTGSGRYATSGRLSYLLGLRGPSLTLDTACSSSLVAIHLAVRSLRSGECELALAGGVNVILQPHVSVAYSQSRMMAPDGRCKFGDARGDGYVRSEGAAVVVLKPLANALADGDRIYAVVRGSAVNNDGRSSGSMGTPSRTGQEALLRTALADAGVAPASVGYIEAHGTGTRAGDPVELGALGSVLGEGRQSPARARVGSVKTNFGHTEGAAGVAGLIKAALALHHARIPPSLHCQELNPAVDWAHAPVEIAREAVAWAGDARVAGVSAFGIAGTNAHVVLESAPPALVATTMVDESTPAAMILPLSARSPEALGALAARYAELVAATAGAPLASLCAAVATRRAALEVRAAFVASDAASLVAQLQAYAAGEQPASAEGQAPSGTRPGVVFVVPGQGAQWVGMGRQLLTQNHEFRATLQRCDEAMAPWADWSICEQLALAPGDAGYLLERIDVIQPTLVALAIAYAGWLRAAGIEPDAVVGHSMGEVAAAQIAGVLDLGDAMHIVCARSQLMRRTSGQGAMALVELGFAEIQARLVGREAELSVAVSNSSRSSVISGDPKAVQEVLASLEAQGVFCRLVKVDVASHSPQMEPLAAELAVQLQGLVPRTARVPVVSTVLGARCEGSTFDAGYWARNLREPVRFTEAAQCLLDDGLTVFVELGPHPLLTAALQQTAQAAGLETMALAMGRREEPDLRAARTALAALWVAGVSPRWPGPLAHVELPGYPWQRERFWVEAAEMRAPGDSQVTRGQKPDEATQAWLYRQAWVALPMGDANPASTANALTSTGLLVCDEPDSRDAILTSLRAAGWRGEGSTLAGLGAALQSMPSRTGAPIDVLVVASSDDLHAARLPLDALQAALANATAMRLWFVTRGAQQLEARQRVAPWQAAAWGAARVVAEEHAGAFGGLIDLDPDLDWAASGAALWGHLRDDRRGEEVALRGDQRHALRLVRHTVTGRSGAASWPSDAACLITGGLGDIGLRVAGQLVQRGVRRLVLLGRTALPPRETWSGLDPQTAVGRRVNAVRALEAAGASVHMAAVDVAREDAMRAFLQRYSQEAWPPIRGVVHAAGSFDNALASRMTREAFDHVVAAKLGGALVLDKLLPELDLFVLFSSTGGFLAQPGQANYAAANAGLDAVARNRRVRGQPALSIAWGVWLGTGLVSDEAGQRNVQEMQRQGIQGFSAEQGVAMFDWLRGRPEPALVVLPIDWARYARSRGARVAPMFSELVAEAGGAGGAGDASSPDALAKRLNLATAAERRTLLDAVVREALGHVLKIAPARIEARRAFGAMGLGSLLAMELRNRLEGALARPLSATLAWNHPTVEALVSHLAGLVAPEASATPAAAQQPGVEGKTTSAVDDTALAATLDELEALSDDEAALALLKTKAPRAPRSKGAS